MATVSHVGTAASGRTIESLVASDGSAGAPHARALIARDARTRDLADAVHTLCALHATAPSMIELAAATAGDTAVGAWLRDAAGWFAGERAALVAITAAVGPLPSTPGQAESEAAVAAQRHALVTLARSSRAGCAVGAAFAFLLDWAAIRDILAAAAARAGADVATGAPIPDPAAVALGRTPGYDRAMLFGAEQLLAQHRGLWQLLEARASARHG